MFSLIIYHVQVSLNFFFFALHRNEEENYELIKNTKIVTFANSFIIVLFFLLLLSLRVRWIDDTEFLSTSIEPVLLEYTYNLLFQIAIGLRNGL